MEIEFSRQILEKYSNKFYENPSSGSRVVQCGQTDGQTDLTKPKRAYKTKATEILEEKMGNEVMHRLCLRVVGEEDKLRWLSGRDLKGKN
jgi:hypothetical protein